MIKFSQKIKPNTDSRVLELSKYYREKGIPTCLHETLNELILQVTIKKPKNVLEIGTAVGISGSAMLFTSDDLFLTTIEKDEDSYNTAKNTFIEFGFSNRVKQYFGDAGDIVRFLEGPYDFIFLDGAKARYYDYLPDLKRILASNGVLFADNVLFRGFIDGGVKYDHRDNTIVRNMRAFLNELIEDDNYICSIYEKGDGILVAYKKWRILNC